VSERRLQGLLLMATVCVFVGQVVCLWDFVVDDAFISFRYARNLAEGHGLVFNPGERVEGYSNFLWVLIISLCIKLGADPLASAKLLGVGLSAGTLAVVWRLSSVLGGAGGPAGRVWDLVAPLLLACNASFALWTVGGMETPLFAFLLALGSFLYLRRREREVAVAWLLPFFLAALTRPEGAMYLLATIAHRAVDNYFRLGGKPFKARELAAVAATLAMGGLYGLWRLAYYGDLTPNTFYAKPGGTAYHFFAGMAYAYDFLAAYGHLTFLALPVVTLFSRVWAWPWVSHVALQMLAAFVFVLYAGPDWMPEYRFLAPIAPLALVLAQEGLRDCFHALKGRWNGEKAGIITGVAITLLLLSYGPRMAASRESARSFAREHAYARGVAGWLRARAVGPATMSVCDAGAYPFFTGFYTIDSAGLMDAHIARLERETATEKCDADYVLSKNPDFIEEQLDIGTMLPKAKAAPVGLDLYLSKTLLEGLYELPEGMRLDDLRWHARWRGGVEMYAHPKLHAGYKALLVYKVPRLWYVVVLERKDKAGTE